MPPASLRITLLPLNIHTISIQLSIFVSCATLRPLTSVRELAANIISLPRTEAPRHSRIYEREALSFKLTRAPHSRLNGRVHLSDSARDHCGLIKQALLPPKPLPRSVFFQLSHSLTSGSHEIFHLLNLSIMKQKQIVNNYR